MQKRRKLGIEGEDRAAEYLEAKGYRIVARNVRADRVEIDLVVRKGSLLVFVEVKARHGTSHGLAAEAVDGRKQRRLRRGAWAWLKTEPKAARGTHGRRFDVVTCVRGPEQKETAEPSQVRRSIRSEALDQTPDLTWTFEHWVAAF